jgi:hypothetical protein
MIAALKCKKGLACAPMMVPASKMRMDGADTADRDCGIMPLVAPTDIFSDRFGSMLRLFAFFDTNCIAADSRFAGGPRA